MAHNPLPPWFHVDWEEERIIHCRAMALLVPENLPRGIPPAGPMLKTHEFPLPTYRCPRATTCPLCAPDVNGLDDDNEDDFNTDNWFDEDDEDAKDDEDYDDDDDKSIPPPPPSTPEEDVHPANATLSWSGKLTRRIRGGLHSLRSRFRTLKHTAQILLGRLDRRKSKLARVKV